MKVVLLAGGFGTRITEESHLKPKPMIEIGGMPILWHIMKSYSAYGYNEFIICCGYKQYVIKDFFNECFIRNSDITFDFTDKANKIKVHKNFTEKWRVTVVDTGLNTMTGGRIKRIKPYLDGEPFMMTYGDGVSDIDLNALEAFHRSHGKLATMTVVNASQRFGVINMTPGGQITSFREKKNIDGIPINGGYMVLDPRVLDYIDGDSTIFEKEPLERLVGDGQLMAYRHDGFWQCMDTMRDKEELELIWNSGKAPWKKWD
ncbi:MAG: glucose-1-phosphate cytidylyltransferase [Ruminococcaceae bacterium]|nr:glucose-1-phosphate cytidylyltransferase [Oscillospiraceae bacterium]